MGQIEKKVLYQEFDRMKKLMTDKNYPGLVRDSVIGTVHSSRDQEKTLADVKALLAQNLTPREMVKALQPIYREDCGIQPRKEQP